MAYEPRGKVKTLVEAMRVDPAKVWTSNEAAAAMDVNQGALSAHLDPAIRHQLIYRQLANGRCAYSLRPFVAAAPAPVAPAPAPTWTPPQMTAPRGNAAPPPIATRAPAVAAAAPAEEPPSVEEDVEEDTEAVPFNAAMWADGDLVIYGAQENEDGSFTLNREQVLQLKRLITWIPA